MKKFLIIFFLLLISLATFYGLEVFLSPDIEGIEISIKYPVNDIPALYQYKIDLLTKQVDLFVQLSMFLLAFTVSFSVYTKYNQNIIIVIASALNILSIFFGHLIYNNLILLLDNNKLIDIQLTSLSDILFYQYTTFLIGLILVIYISVDYIISVKKY